MSRSSLAERRSTPVFLSTGCRICSSLFWPAAATKDAVAEVIAPVCHIYKSHTLTSGLLLGSSEVLRSLRHYLRPQSQGRQTFDRLEERGAEKGSARRSSLKGRERAIVNQTNIGTVSKATLGKLLERRGGAHMGFS